MKRDKVMKVRKLGILR